MISVIVPIYKVEGYLSKCVESIINQAYKDLEIILVDDGSPDNCPKICDEFARKDSRIKVIHKQNGGVSSARNVGIDCSKGEYISFIDPDDWIQSNMYEDMLGAMEENNKVDIVICGYNYIKEDGGIDREYHVKEKELLEQSELLYRLSDMPPTVRHGVVNKLFKRTIIDGLRFSEDLHSSEDVLFLTEYLEKVRLAAFLHEPLYMNLVREGSATHGGLRAEDLAKSFKVHEKMFYASVKCCPKIREHALAFLLDVCTLKYKQIVRQNVSRSLRKKLRRFIKKYAIKALFNKEIYWKTRISYLLIR